MLAIVGSICVGDKTSCGGTVVTGSPFSDVDGKAIARVGDKISCRYNCVITDGNPAEIVDGAALALHGSATSHGCTCVSNRNNKHGDGKTEAQQAAMAVAADAGLAFIPEVAQLLTEDHWVAFKLVDGQEVPIPHQAFELTDPSGKVTTGIVDENGCGRVDSVKAGACQVRFPDLNYSMTVVS